jgi:putative transposase
MVMPDHVHLLATPMDRDASVSAFSKWFKRWFNEALRPDWSWQEGCFDRLLRSDESAFQKWEYIRYNPVRAGLVKTPDEWPYQTGFEL